MTPVELRTVACESPVVVSVTADLQHRCPFVDELDSGTVTITWTTTDRTIELHSLRVWLATFADVKASHEQITDLIQIALLDAGVTDVEVASEWPTAGMRVRVNAVLRQRVEPVGA